MWPMEECKLARSEMVSVAFPPCSTGLFLPVMWEQIASPQDFVRHLKNKAGLPLDHWSDTLQAWLYTTESFGAKFAPASAAPN